MKRPGVFFLRVDGAPWPAEFPAAYGWRVDAIAAVPRADRVEVVERLSNGGEHVHKTFERGDDGDMYVARTVRA